MKTRYILLLSVLVCFDAGAQNRSQSLVNPQFIKYLNEGDYSMRLAPAPMTICFENYKGSGFTLEPFYDLREHNWVSSVKNKGDCGCCYSFAAMGCLESAWLKSGIPEYDLSEEHLRTCNGFEQGADGSCSGGDIFKVTSYLTRHWGPVTESLDLYTASADASCPGFIAPLATVDQMRLLLPAAAVIKQAIKDQGGIFSAMYFHNLFFRSSDNTYFYSGNLTENHAVLLVGWDDNKNTEGGTGAWIVKNDFGTDWGEEGYFYVSYSDHRILASNAYFLTRNVYDSYESLYQYNLSGWTSSTGWNDNSAYGLVKFISDGRNPIRKIGTWVNTDGATLNIEVYDQFNGSNLSVRLASLTEISCPNAGYYTFDLPNPLYFYAGDDFYIKIKYVTPGNINPIPVEKKIDGYVDPDISTGVCWISHSGSGWTALGADAASDIDRIDLCIKAYGTMNIFGVEEQENLICTLYPNPADQECTLEFPQNTKALKLDVTDVTGQSIYTDDIPAGSCSFKIPTGDFYPGVYLVSVWNGTQKWTSKLMVK